MYKECTVCEKLLGSWLQTVTLFWLQMTVYSIDNTVVSRKKTINYVFIIAFTNVLMVYLMTHYLRLTLESGMICE